MKSLTQLILVSMMLLIGFLAFFYVLGQLILFLEQYINPFIFAPLLVGVVIYGTLTLLNGGD